MAYFSQEMKAKIAPAIQKILKKYGMKGSLSVRNNSGLNLTLKSGNIDFGDAHWINPHHYQNHYTGKALAFLNEVLEVMSSGNWDNSEPMTDYYDIGWYVYINVGKWNTPYVLTK